MDVPHLKEGITQNIDELHLSCLYNSASVRHRCYRTVGGASFAPPVSGTLRLSVIDLTVDA